MADPDTPTKPTTDDTPAPPPANPLQASISKDLHLAGTPGAGKKTTRSFWGGSKQTDTAPGIVGARWAITSDVATQEIGVQIDFILVPPGGDPQPITLGAQISGSEIQGLVTWLGQRYAQQQQAAKKKGKV